MKNKTTQKRLLLYLFFSFLLTWLPIILFQVQGGTYYDSDKYITPGMHALLSFIMLAPSVSMLLTRWITKEGFPMTGNNSLGLGISFSNRKWIWYLAAILLPSVYLESGMGLMYLFFPGSYDPGMLTESGIPTVAAWLFPIVSITSNVLASIGALGEEAGWRGYMMPKLEELFGIKKAVLIGGIIWGIWHYPAIAIGHNFGTGYLGEPWSGFLIFTLMTISIGAILTYLTKKSSSVWPAAFMHAVNNGGGSILMLFFNSDKIPDYQLHIPLYNLIQGIPLYFLGLIAFLLLCRDSRTQ